GITALAVALYVLYLDLLVTHQFEGRRWTLPAQVYAAPLELYAGLALSPAELEGELQRLGYRRTTALDRPATYRVQGERIDVALRPGRFADAARTADRAGREHPHAAAGAKLLPQHATDVHAQDSRSDHGDGAGCALHQGGSHERLHQRDLPRPGRRSRHSRLRARQPVLFRQAARRARPLGGGAPRRGGP